MSVEKKVNPSHILGVDAIRFVAALMVVWFHFAYLMGQNPNGGAGTASRHLLAFPELFNWSYFGWVGVEIFFVISGFVIAFSAEKATAFTFFTSRVVRLLPGVWICSSITLATVLALGSYDKTEIFRAYRHSMAFLNWGPWIDGAFWTLVIEISFYFCVFLLIFAKKFKEIDALAIFIGTCSTAFIILRAFVQAEFFKGKAFEPFMVKYEHYTDLLLLHHGVYFALGIFLWLHLVKKPSITNLLWIALFGAAGCLEVAVQAGIHALSVCAVWSLGVVGIVQSVRLNNMLHRAPQWFLRALKSAGLMTFPLYLVHMIVGATVMGRLVMLGLSRWAALAGGVMLVVLLAYVVSTYMEPALQRGVKRVLYWGHGKWQAFKPTSADIV